MQQIENQSFNVDRLIVIIVFSVATHLLFVAQKVSTNVSLFEDAKKEQPVKIKIISDSSTQENQANKNIVFTADSKDKLEGVKIDYMGKKLNTFSRQTKARKSAAFNEGGKTGARKKSEKSERKKAAKKNKKIDFGNLAMAKKYKVKDGTKKSNQGQNVGVGSGVGKGVASSYDSVSEDIPLGDFNKINTQEHKYFSFYERIKSKLEFYWGQNIEKQVLGMYRTGRSIASSMKLTSLEVNLNRAGQITGIKLKTTSGYKELDGAAIDAFNKAGPFPNPPSELVKNGHATIKWGFELH